MSSPPIRDGAIAVVDGLISAVGPADQVIATFRHADLYDFGPATILPGLVNSHTHLDLSAYIAGDPWTSSFINWILSIRSRQNVDFSGFAGAIQDGIDQSLAFGATCVGDITQHGDISRQILAQSPLRAVSFGEVLGLARRRARFDELFPIATNPRYATDRLRIGLSPHSPYTVDLEGYRQCIQAAKTLGIPLTTHLAETPDERAFLLSQSGPFRELWETIGSWDQGVSTFPGSPIEMAKAIGLLDIPSVLAHVNYCTDAELDLLTNGQASVVYCPRTHQYFGHPPHRWREMLARGINVAVGTDSCASSPNLNLVDDLRLLRKLAPEIPATNIWEMATTRAAKALSWPGIGALAPGYHADFVIFDSAGDDPLDSILQSNHLPIGTWIGGDKVC